jgi:CRISPR-associated protein Cas5a/b/c
MSDAAVEIATQPQVWGTALALPPPDGLPLPGERVAVIGCGTSLHVAIAYARLREAAGQGETDAWPASEFPPARRYDRVLGISRTGTTTEVLRALPTGVPTTGFTSDPGSPLAAMASSAVVLDFAQERSVVATRFPTALLVLLRAGLGEDVTHLPPQAAAALSAPLPVAAAGEFRQYTFLGTGWVAGVAMEAALKLREAAGAWAEAYPAMEYRHGPISVADAGSLVWFLGEPPAGLEAEVRATGASVRTSGADPLAELVRVQRLAVELAESRGLDPDRPRHLARSIILR